MTTPSTSATIEFVTFLLAIIGYIGLCFNLVTIVRGRFQKPYMAATAIVILIHVFMVWAFRYDWAFSQATRNGYVGFLLFHSALLCIIIAVFSGTETANKLVVAAFLIVSAGAIGATFRYDVVAMYRIPVLIIAAIGITALGKSYYDKRKLRHAL
jgi:hypothetical protein